MAKALRLANKFVDAGWYVHLLLNVDAVRLVDPQAQLDPCPITGKPLAAMLSAFIDHGGKVMVGAECLKLIGLGPDDLGYGQDVASFPMIEALMSKPAIKILSY